MTRPASAAVALTSVLAAAAGHASDCAALANHEMPSVHIAAQIVPAQADVPEFCRVQGEARPTADSQIGFEVWLPASGWNGRYHQLGNGDYYGTPPRYRYFTGCSNGGRQALVAAQRFPEQWDGILAGAPALDWTRQLATFAAQPAGDVRSQLTLAEQFFRYMVYDDPAWTLGRFDRQRDFDFARRRRIGNETLSQVLDATDPDLTRFEQRGGKLLMYFGWADDLISPQAGVDYYERVVARMGGIERRQAFFRLFMVPGMGHCQGGAAPHAFGQAYVAPGLRDDSEHDIRRALEAWVEQGKVPERIVEAAQVLHPYQKGER